MLNQTYSQTKFFKKTIDINFDINNLKEMSFKKDDLYYTNNGDLELKNEIIINSKNIFSVYTNGSYDLYTSISEGLKEACNLYDINILIYVTRTNAYTLVNDPSVSRYNQYCVHQSGFAHRSSHTFWNAVS